MIAQTCRQLPRSAPVSLTLSLLLAACRSPAPDPAPPPASYELATAPPGARGARAAGTDAAPPPPSAGVLGEAADYARQGQLAALRARAPELVPKPAMPEPGPVGSAAAPATSGLPAPSAH